MSAARGLRVVSGALRRRHRSSYVVMCLAVAAAAALTCASLCVAVGGMRRDGAGPDAGLSSYARVVRNVYYSGAAEGGAAAAAGCLFVSVFLVTSSSGFLVEQRRREFAFLRLAGASPGRVRVLVLAELAAPLLAASAAGALLGLPLAVPFARALAAAGGAPAGFSPRLRLSCALASFLAVAVAGLLGAFFSARRIARVSPMEALRTPRGAARTVGPARATLMGVALTAALVLGFAPLAGLRFEVRVMLVAALLCVALGQGCPLVVPFAARGVGMALTCLSGGAGLVARQRAARDARHTSALAMPVMLLLVLAPCFMAMVQTATIVNTATSFAPLKAAVVARSSRAAGRRALEGLDGTDGRVRAPTTYTLDRWTMPGDDAMVHLVASVPRAQLLDVHGANGPVVLEGGLTGLGPGRVAVSESAGRYTLGQRVRLVDARDRVHVVTIVARVASPAAMDFDFLAETGSLDGAGSDATTLAFARTRPGQSPERAARALQAAMPDGVRVYTKRSYIDYYAGVRRQGQRGMGLIIYGSALLALIFVMQSAATAARQRRGEDRLLRDLCAPRRTIVAASAFEAVIDVAAATLLSAAAIGATWASMSLELRRGGIGQTASLPASQFLALAALALIAATATATIQTLRSTTTHARDTGEPAISTNR